MVDGFGMMPGDVDEFGRVSPFAQQRPRAQMPAPSPYAFAGGMPGLGDDAISPLPPGMGGLLSFGQLPIPQPEPQAPRGLFSRPRASGGPLLGFGPGSPAAAMPLPSRAAPNHDASVPRIRPFGALPTRPVDDDAAPEGSMTNPPLPPRRPAEFGANTDDALAAPAAMGAPQGQAPGGEGPGFLGSFRSAVSPYSDLMMGIGMGLMTKRGIGPAIASGVQYADQLSNSSAARDLASAKQAESAFKLRQQLGNSDQLAQLAMQKNPGMTMAQARAAVGNQTYANELLKGFVPPTEQFQQYSDPQGNVWKVNTRTGERTISLQAKDEKAPTVRTFTNPDGTTEDRVWNAGSQTFERPNFGANPPVMKPEDLAGIPPGVDPDTYRKELAKKTVAQQSSATDRANQASTYIPILERAERAYEALGKPNALGATALGPLNASAPNRFIGGVFGANSEKMRQEYEAAAKDLELAKAQISMKGQGSITDSERRLLALTLPRLDAADPETGLRTLRDLRGQFERTLSRERLPSYGQGGQPANAPVPQGDTNRRATRFEELTRSGLSKQDAFARMRQEGF